MKKNKFKIFLNGARAEVHDRFIKDGFNNFEKTFKEIKKISGLKNKNKFVLNSNVYTSDCERYSNYFRLNAILKKIKKLGFKKAQFNLINPKENNLIASLDEVALYISKARYVFLFDLFLKVSGLPYCLVPEPESFIKKSNHPKNFVKLKQCQKCAYNYKCDGILKGYLKNLDKEKIKPKQLPREIIIEATHKCNFKCDFCFNQSSFAKKKRQGDELTTSYIKQIIDNFKKENIPIVRFTGGEPLLRQDILELIKYAKQKGLQVRLNTNGSLINSYTKAKKLAKYLDYILFSLHTCDPKEDEQITKFKNSFEKKIKAIKWMKRAGVKIVNVSTVATLKNIKNSEKFYKLFKDLKINKWMVNRVIPNPGDKIVWGEQEAPLLMEKLVKIKKDIVKHEYPLKVHLINALPFCADDPIKINAVCGGAKSVDGHERFVIDPRGFAKPMYYIEKNIGDPLKLQACWNHDFMKKLRDYKYLPKDCQKCSFLEKCKGGDRYSAYFFNHNYSAKDPLMDVKKIKEYIF